DGFDSFPTRRSSDLLVVQFNNGSGFEPWEYWGSLDSPETGDVWGGPHASANSISTCLMLVDINGDGLADRVMRTVGAPYTPWKVQINTGSGFSPVTD